MNDPIRARIADRHRSWPVVVPHIIIILVGGNGAHQGDRVVEDARVGGGAELNELLGTI